MSALVYPVPSLSASREAKTEMWFGRLLWLAAGFAILGLLAQFALMFWAQNEFSDPESIVAVNR